MHRILAGGLAAALALVVGAAQAQATNEPPAQTSPDITNGKKPAALERAENSRPAQATKRVAKKGTHAAKRAGHRTADAMRSTGGAIERRLPDPGNTRANGAGSSAGNTSEIGTQR